MIPIRQFRDVETLFRQFNDELRSLKDRKIPDDSDFVRRSEWNKFLEQELARTIVSSFRGSTGSDIEVIPEQQLIVHNLDHRFNKASVKDFRIRDNGGLDNEWQIIALAEDGASADEMIIFYLPGTTEFFRLEKKLVGTTTDLAIFTCNAVPSQSDLWDLGKSGTRWNKLWVKDVDISGNVTGFTGGDNNYKQGIASSSLSLSTSFQDVTGATVSLDQDGVWLIIINGYISRVSDDVDPQITLNYDGTEETDVASIGISSIDSVAASVSQTYIKTVTSQPKTAKITGKKASGTGSSSVISGHTRITAVFLKP